MAETLGKDEDINYVEMAEKWDPMTDLLEPIVLASGMVVMPDGKTVMRPSSAQVDNAQFN